MTSSHHHFIITPDPITAHLNPTRVFSSCHSSTACYSRPVLRRTLKPITLLAFAAFAIPWLLSAFFALNARHGDGANLYEISAIRGRVRLQQWPAEGIRDTLSTSAISLPRAPQFAWSFDQSSGAMTSLTIPLWPPTLILGLLSLHLTRRDRRMAQLRAASLLCRFCAHPIGSLPLSALCPGCGAALQPLKLKETPALA